MSLTAYREVCTDLLKGLEECQEPRFPFPGYITAAMDRARELLARPAPTDQTLAALVEPVRAPTSDEEEKLLVTARAAQAAGTFPSDSAIRLLTDGYGAGESERRHCMAAARLALAYWGHAWDCLDSNQPVPAEPAAPVDLDARLRHCPTHGQQPPEVWGCPECLRELREELAALRTLPADGPSIEQLGPLISWLLEQCDQAANAGRSTDAGMLLWAAQVVGERVDEDAPDANLHAEGAAWQAAATLRRLAAQNPMGVTDPAIISAAELIERLAGKLVMLRQERPHG